MKRVFVFAGKIVIMAQCTSMTLYAFIHHIEIS